ncbi:MAG: xylulokinase [Oscillospiraceae bacterium]|jgi:xylulokinase|nr:xylulokinase [Oscillospiraceae bacterium]
MKPLLLGIDVGTSGCKAALFCPDGTALAQAAKPYDVQYPFPGFAEQDPEAWWEAVCLAVRDVLEQSGTPVGRIAGVGVDGQSWSAIAVDSQGNVLCPNPIWTDSRAAGICAELDREIGSETLFSLCGNPLKPTYTLPKVLWYKKHRPDIYDKTDKILQTNSFIVYRLTGSVTQDKSQGYGWHCYDMRQNTWNTEMCAAVGLRPSLLPELFDCHRIAGGVSARAAALTGLMPGTPVVAGGLDAACGTLGAGVIHAGETQEQGGQAGGMSICLDTYRADERLILSAHVVPDRWLLQGGTTGGGGVMKWFDREFGTGDFTALDQQAATVPAGCNGLIFLPYMAGERSPVWDANAKGVYFGIDFSKTRGHFIRAALEGVAFSLRHNLDAAGESGVPTRKLLSVGGAANSALWTQIKADVTGKSFEIPASNTATALGAAILAGVGAEVYASFDEAVKKAVKIKKRVEPDRSNAEVYDEAYKTYLALYRQLKPITDKRSGTQ